MMAEAGRGTLGRIFLSYRREDAADAAGWIYDQLTTHFGDGHVVRDVDSVELADDIAQGLVAVGSCEVLVVLITDRWLTITGADGTRALDDPEDSVRREIETALTRGVRIVPVLLNGARMPKASDLPLSLTPLADRWALDLSVDSDIGELAERLEPPLYEGYSAALLPVPSATQPPPRPQSRYDDLVSKAFDDEIHPGRLIFNPPDHMRLGDTERVEVVLARTFELDAELLRNLRGHGTPQLEEIPTSPTMAVTLHGDGFQVTPHSDEEQDVTPDESATWEFDIRAVKRGPQRLYMSVSLRVPVPGQPLKHKSIPVREATIDVQVGAPALVGRFISQNWQWFIGTTIAAAAVIVAVLVH